jgi:DNA processing protein
VGVLGSGVDVVYPDEHAALAEAMCAAGALVSELPPGAPPRRFHFPWRNRIISGLARAIVVVEASLKSGSLITARCGLDQGREVMAVPGNILSDRNRGAHALIKDGAKIVEAVDDILDELIPLSGAATPPPAAGVPTAAAAVGWPAGKLDDPLLAEMCCGESYDLDALMRLTGSDLTSLLPRLLQLELRGLVSRCGGRFVRSGGR